MIEVFGTPTCNALDCFIDAETIEEWDGMTLMQKLKCGRNTYLKTWVDACRESQATRWMIFRCDDEDLLMYMKNEVTLLQLIRLLMPMEIVLFVDEKHEMQSTVKSVFAKNIPSCYLPKEDSWYDK